MPSTYSLRVLIAYVSQTQHGGVRLTIDSPFIGAFSVQPDYIEGSSDFDIILNDPGIFNQLDFDRDHAKEFAISVGVSNQPQK